MTRTGKVFLIYIQSSSVSNKNNNMKKILTLILLLSFFSCDKDEPDTLSAKYSKQEIFNAVVGTWKFSRLGYDPEFKKLKM